MLVSMSISHSETSKESKESQADREDVEHVRVFFCLTLSIVYCERALESKTYSEIMSHRQPRRPISIGEVSRKEVIEIDQPNISNHLPMWRGTYTAQIKVRFNTRLGMIGYLAKKPSQTPQPINNNPPTTSKAIILGFLYPPSALYTKVNGARIQANAKPIKRRPKPFISDMVCLKVSNRDRRVGDKPSRICCLAYVDDANERAEHQLDIHIQRIQGLNKTYHLVSSLGNHPRIVQWLQGRYKQERE